MGLVLPTVSGRIQSLDVARGVAILGILLANIGAFALPFISYEMIGAEPHLTGREAIVDAIRLAFVTGKFRSLLAILFGVGLYLQFQKRQATPKAWPGGYLKRTGWLAVIGLCHGLFFWFGDILFAYALCALLVVPMVRINTKAMLGIAIGGLLLSTLIGAGMAFMQSGAGASSDDLGQLTEQFPLLTALFDPTGETALYADGSYLSQLAIRALIGIVSLFQIPIIALHIVPLMLIGVLLGRSGFLARPASDPRLARQLLNIGFVGLLINCGLAAWRYSGTPYGVDNLAEMGLASLLSVGYLALIAISCEHGVGIAGRLIGNVGKMALTCYLGQTLMATFFFYSWGLGYFGQFDQVQLLTVVVVIWLVNIIGATLWLRYFTMGPIEFLWRRLSYRSRFSIRRGEEPVIAPPPAPPAEPPTGPASL